jgi:hypothetical protein
MAKTFAAPSRDRPQTRRGILTDISEAKDRRKLGEKGENNYENLHLQ